MIKRFGVMKYTVKDTQIRACFDKRFFTYETRSFAVDYACFSGTLAVLFRMSF